MREITTHHDGHGLAESIAIGSDGLGPGGAAHHYVATSKIDGLLGMRLAEIQFQKGPRLEEGSTPGIIDTVLLAIVADRLRCFQAGPFPSEEGQDALELIEAAMACFKRRADLRAARGVLGKAEP